MAYTDENNRCRQYFTAHVPEGSLISMSGKELGLSSTLSDARERLARHLFRNSWQGRSAQFQEWEFCLTYASREKYIQWTYDAEADTWSDPAIVTIAG